MGNVDDELLRGLGPADDNQRTKGDIRMPNQTIDKPTKDFLKEAFGYNDEQISTGSDNPTVFEVINSYPVLLSKKLVMTCVEAENCAYNKIDDKYVFNGCGHMIKNETCETPCLWAMSGFFRYSFLLYDRVASGLNLEGMHMEYVSCPDTGCSFGGMGKAIFRVSVEDA